MVKLNENPAETHVFRPHVRVSSIRRPKPSAVNPPIGWLVDRRRRRDRDQVPHRGGVHQHARQDQWDMGAEIHRNVLFNLELVAGPRRKIEHPRVVGESNQNLRVDRPTPVTGHLVEHAAPDAGHVGATADGVLDRDAGRCAIGVGDSGRDFVAIDLADLAPAAAS